VKTVLLALGCLALVAPAVSADAARPSVALSLGYSSAYKFSESWDVSNQGLGEITLALPLGTHVILVPSVGYGRYSGDVASAVGDRWEVSVDVVPVGIGARIQSSTHKPLIWYAQESALLVYYHWQSEQTSGFDSWWPKEERRDELLLGLKLGGGGQRRVGRSTFAELGLDYVLSEDVDTSAGGIAGFHKQGLRQLQLHVGIGWKW